MKPVIGQNEIGHDEIDRILSRKDDILPSSGFAVSVMDAVRREAAAPPAPIPFPWMRALPGLVVGASALVLVLIAGVVAIAQADKTATAPQFSMPSAFAMPPLFHGGMESAAIWSVLALLVAFVSVKLSMRVA
jgi:hypothetical protein